jgi:hypothetical protein
MNHQELSDWLRGLVEEVKETKPKYIHNVLPG